MSQSKYLDALPRRGRVGGWVGGRGNGSQQAEKLPHHMPRHAPGLVVRYVSTVSGPAADTDRIHRIWAEYGRYGPYSLDTYLD